MITLVPAGGLCNRLRAIHSAVLLCSEYSRELNVYWRIKEKSLNCGFYHLFQKPGLPNIAVKDISGDHPLYYSFSKRAIRQREQYFDLTLFSGDTLALINKNFDFSELIRYHRVFIETWSAFYLKPERRMYAYLIPLPEIVRKIEAIERNFSKNMIGIHIRRTDHPWSIEQSPLQFFIEAIEAEIREDPSVTFFLATDSLDVKKHLLRLFGTRIMIQTLDEARRTDAEGMQEAVTDLFLLSKTKKIYRTYGSSFSLFASQLSGIPAITLTRKEAS